ncbi:MAG: hypothetical protein ABEH47_08535 [Haloferacaceae archaeon]
MRSPTWARLVAALGLLLLASVAAGALVPGTPESPVHRVADLLVVGGSGLCLLYAAYWHAERPLLGEQYPRIFGWTGVTTVLFVGIGVLTLYIGSRRVEPTELLEVLHATASVGLATGLFVGTTHARVVDAAEVAARADARAEALAAERERAERLNDLLRHYVLNGVNVVTGHVDRLRSVVPEEDGDALDAVDRRARSMATLVQHVNSLLASERGHAAATTVDLVAAVEAAVADVRGGPSVRVRTPGAPLPVLAAETLDDVLDLLFDAVTSATGPGGEIDVRCEGGETHATVTITATPVDLPEPLDDSLFEPVRDAGMEFYLSRRLLDGYGDLRLRDADPGTLRVELRVENP